MTRLTIAIALFALAVSTSTAQPRWRHLSGPTGGAAFNIIESPSGSLFVHGVDEIFRSTDDGRTWSSRTSGLPMLRLPFIIATANGSLLLTLVDSGRTTLYRSTDEGASWALITESVDAGFEPTTDAIAADSADGSVYIASATNVYRSTDNGASWIRTPSPVGGTSLQVFDGNLYLRYQSALLRIDTRAGYDTSSVPMTPGAIASSYWLVRDDLLVGMTGPITPILRRSSDAGTTWRTLDSGEYASRWSVGPRGEIYGLSRAVFRMNDGDADFTELRLLPYLVRYADALSTRTGTIITASNLGIDRSTDNGVTWSAAQDGFATHEVSALLTSPSGPLFAVTQSFVNAQLMHSMSEDGGSTWSDPGVLPFTYHEEMPVAIARDGTMYVSGSTGVFRTEDYGASWSGLGTIDAAPALRLAVRGDTLVAINARATMLSSLDRGATWSLIEYPDGDYTTPGAVAFAPDGSLLFTHRANHWRSLDLGATWQRTPLVTTGERFVPSHNGHIYMVSSDGLLRSGDGLHWDVIHALQDRDITSFAATSTGHLLQFADSLVYSDDYGTTWRHVDAGLERALVSSVAADADGAFYAATFYNGIFKLEGASSARDERQPGVASDAWIVVTDDPDVVAVHHTSASDAPVLIDVVDALGRSVALHTGVGGVAGTHVERISIAELRSGAYYVRVRRGGEVRVVPMVVRR